jgi:hypothetical protein
MNTDWKMLREQKQTLLNVIGAADTTAQEHLTGILHLIDSIQDSAAGNPNIGAEIVFGPQYQLTHEQQMAVQDLRGAGWAVTLINPGKLGEVDPQDVQYAMRHAAHKMLERNGWKT